MPQRPQASTPLRVTGISWITSLFLISTLLIALVGTPLYLWHFGLGTMEVVLFLSMVVVTAMSITVGYHRLFTHRAFSARWPVRLATLLFGAATFEMSALRWASQHRYHHKHTDQDGDPHDPHSIKRGFFWAHVGWMLFKAEPGLKPTNVDDLRRDPLVVWQDRHYIPIAVAVGFVLPMTAGTSWAYVAGSSVLLGLLAGFLFGGCARIALVHHVTFLINSLAHTIGRRPYDQTSSARDSGLLALLTFGEGYHNFHHAFQNDYRNGIRPWHFDPSKWTIWTLSKLGLANQLRQVPEETIRLARLREKRRRLAQRLEVAPRELGPLGVWMNQVEGQLEELHLRVRSLRTEYSRMSREKRAHRPARFQELKREFNDLRRDFRDKARAWQQAYRQALALMTRQRAGIHLDSWSE